MAVGEEEGEEEAVRGMVQSRGRAGPRVAARATVAVAAAMGWEEEEEGGVWLHSALMWETEEEGGPVGVVEAGEVEGVATPAVGALLMVARRSGVWPPLVMVVVVVVSLPQAPLP